MSLLPVRISAARALLVKLLELLDADGSKFPGKLEPSLRAVAGAARGLDAVPDLLEARSKMFEVLTSLDAGVEAGLVRYAEVKIPFVHARLLAVQGYVAVSWSIADLIAEFVSGIFCRSELLRNNKSSAKLWEHFVRDDKVIALSTQTLAREAFGLPVAVSYIIRNFFVHEGGQHEGVNMFAGPTVGDRFALSSEGWSAIQAKMKQYGVQVTETRAPEPWPWPTSDLRSILAICEREMDDLLGILVGTACATVREQAAFLVGVS